MKDEGAIYESDGLVLDATVTFQVGAVITSTAGCTVEAHARPVNGGSVVVGVGSVLSATKIRATFAQWAFVAGDWRVQCRLIPAVGNGQVVSDDLLTISHSIKPRP